HCLMMEPDAQLRNERCVDSCAGKLIRSNHRLMATYVQLMPRMVQRRMEEMEIKAAENAKLEAAAAATPGLSFKGYEDI
uniref:Translocase of inner mitochondrial membrane 10 homolog B (yeast) n=1 Tax=Neogobius melanostomus TaxID=47308 RepID=A0A8C6SXW5_9GOBI